MSDYDWYNPSSSNCNPGYYSTDTNEGQFYSDTSQLQPSINDHQKFDVEEAKSEYKLGLKLTKTDSLLNLLSCAAQTDNSLTSSTEKLKAANFPALSLQIGSYTINSRHEGELVAKCYFKKRQLVWEVLKGSLKNKIEFQWSNIVAIKATFHTSGPGVLGPGVLDVMLEKPPLFFREIKPQPRKHTNWEQSGDFTQKHAASFIRKHKLIFAPGILEKHYFKIIQADSKLGYLSEQPFPYQASEYFNEIQFSNQICYENNYSVPLPPQISRINHPVIDYLRHTSSATYPTHQEFSPNNKDLPFANSSSMSQESSATFQPVGYAYTCINDFPATNDVVLNPFDYSLSNNYLPQMDSRESHLSNNNYLPQMDSRQSHLPYMGDSSHQSSYDYEESVADQHQSSHEYQSQHYYDYYN